MAFAVDVVTIFPGFFQGPLDESLIKRARKSGKIDIGIHNLRDFTYDRHKTVDDKPFGGGPGMVMKPDPIFECVEALQKKKPKGFVVLMDPAGEPLTQKVAEKLAGKKRLIIVCGHYEGIDHRVAEHLADQLVSAGDYVTMGGEAPALCLMEAVLRFVPGVVGNQESLKQETFQTGNLEYPQYTRPRDFRGWKVPDVLVSGHHKEVAKWREEIAGKRTKKHRPDLIRKKIKGESQ